MPSLKNLKNSIASVKSTQKITSAMKMVSASKLRRAQDQALSGRPYADRLNTLIQSLVAKMPQPQLGPKLLAGTGQDQKHLLVVMTADRGLCGNFNGAIIREARRAILKLQSDCKQVSIITIGRKGYDQLKKLYPDLILEHHEDLAQKKLSFEPVHAIAEKILDLYESGKFDSCSIFYSKFKSVISQEPTEHRIIPFAYEKGEASEGEEQYLYEPGEEDILAELLPKNISIQLYRALLENIASEHGARMSAMDNATRNAGDMIKKLTLIYNRTRQAAITKELIEIISGAEAV